VYDRSLTRCAQGITPGLYATSNVAANVSGIGYYGGIGIGMTFGYICGKHAAKETAR